jgi:tetratricopeptide (TPR) repeat protein
MQARVADLLADLHLIRQLEEIRNRQNDFPDHAGMERSFARLFADFGIDVNRLSPAEIAARIRHRPTMVVRLAAALDDWAIIRRDKAWHDKQEAATWQRLLEAARLADPDPWRSQLRQLMGREDLNALRQLADSSDIQALPVQSLRLMGNALIFGGDAVASVAWLRKAHRQHPGDVLISFDLAWRLGDLPSPPWPEVLQYAEAAVAAKPDAPAMHILVGDNLSRLGRHEEAIAAFAKAIDLKPDYWEAWGKRGQAYLKLGEKDKALADCFHLVEQNPRQAWAWNFRGVAYNKLDQYDKALADYTKGLKLQPDFAVLQHNLAWLLATCPDSKLREPKRAVELAQKAVKTAPQEGNFWVTLGAARYRTADWKAAAAALQEADKLLQPQRSFQKGVGRALFFQAMAQQQLANAKEARQAYDRALQWLETNRKALEADPPIAEELRRFQAEAEEVLKIEKQAKPK